MSADPYQEDTGYNIPYLDAILAAHKAQAAAEAAMAYALAEVRRIDALRSADQDAVAAALAAQKEAVSIAQVASDKAINKAEEAQLRVNATQNEFRGQLRDQNLTNMPRLEAENLVRELRGLIGDRQDEIGELRSRLDVGPIGLQALQTRADTSAGSESGKTAQRAMMLSAVSVVAAIIAALGTIVTLMNMRPPS